VAATVRNSIRERMVNRRFIVSLVDQYGTNCIVWAADQQLMRLTQTPSPNLPFVLDCAPEVKSASLNAKIVRKTKETDVRLDLNLDGKGRSEIHTGVPMFDHLLSQVAKHSRFDLSIVASGDDPHHLAEDVAICLGKALNEALGEKRGITRMADASVPLDDALAAVSIDISGRGYSVLDTSFAGNDMLGFPADMIRHFIESFAVEAG
jgi:imidazoleglycerol-phosphate dehydratase